MAAHIQSRGRDCQNSGSDTNRPSEFHRVVAGQHTADAHGGWQGSGGNGGSSIFTALEGQSGLKLTGGKGPIEVLVDHVEKAPTGN